MENFKIFPLSNQKGGRTDNINAELMHSISQRSKPLTPDEFNEQYLKHKKYLQLTDKEARWETLVAAGLTLAIFMGGKSDEFPQASFHNENLTLLNFENIDLSCINFVNIYYPNGNFKNCVVYNSMFIDSVLDNTDFSGADLRKCDFSRSLMRNCNFTGADLRGADFENCDLTGSIFVNVQLENSRFPGAILDNIVVDKPHHREDKSH